MFVFLQHVKFFFKAGGVLSLCNFSLNIIFGTVLLRTHDVQFPFFLHDGKMFVEAGGFLSLCNYPWKLDLRLWWYTHLVCSVCFLASCKVFY